MTLAPWAAAGIAETEATNPETAPPASKSRRFVPVLIVAPCCSFNAIIY
jgi:hypothetical protein